MMNRTCAVDQARGNTSTGADAAAGPVDRFLNLVREAIDTRTLQRLVLSRPARKMLPPGFVDEGPVLQRVRVRPVRLRDGVKLAFGWQYDTRDQTDNLPLDEALVRIAGLLGDMRSALLETSALTAELGFGKRGTPLFRMKRREAAGGADRVDAACGEGRAHDAAAGGRDASSTEGAVGGVPLGNGGSTSSGDAGSIRREGRESSRENWQQGTGALTQLRRVSRAGGVASGDDLPMDMRTGHARPMTADDDGWGALDTQNRQRRYPVGIDRPFLVDLGLVGRSGALVPAMARKWRQINKFVEIVARAWQRTALCGQVGGEGQRPLRIRDYGAGKGYLTFALHDYLTHQLGLQVETVGVERRADLVALCNRLAQKNGLIGLRFEKGDILPAKSQEKPYPQVPVCGTGTPVPDMPQDMPDEALHFTQGEVLPVADSQPADLQPTDIIIALHACDTATDDALWQGIRQQAAMLVCSPCCHRELRLQLQAPAPLTALLRHGIHLGLEAEMLTDGLRALLLETQGYEAQVFEFISPDDTGKNRMILGCRTGRARPAAEAWAEIDALKAFYGIRHQQLDALLRGRHEGK